MKKLVPIVIILILSGVVAFKLLKKSDEAHNEVGVTYPSTQTLVETEPRSPSEEPDMPPVESLPVVPTEVPRPERGYNDLPTPTDAVPPAEIPTGKPSASVLPEEALENQVKTDLESSAEIKALADVKGVTCEKKTCVIRFQTKADKVTGEQAAVMNFFTQKRSTYGYQFEMQVSPSDPRLFTYKLTLPE